MWDLNLTPVFSCAIPAVFLHVCVIRAFTNKYYKLRDKGTYECISCGRDLFDSTTKYDSGSGWPAFYDVIDPKGVKLTKDASHGMCCVCVIVEYCFLLSSYMMRDSFAFVTCSGRDSITYILGWISLWVCLGSRLWFHTEGHLYNFKKDFSGFLKGYFIFLFWILELVVGNYVQ